jgi:SAM-dependent methyltransferase
MTSTHSLPRAQLPEVAHANRSVGLRAFLKQQGWHFNETPKRIEGRLRRLMGEERYADWLHVTDQFHAGVAPISTVYDFFSSRLEAVTAMSHQAAFTEKCFMKALASAQDHMGPGAKVADLGCYVGDTTRWLALQQPTVTVVGIDRLANLLDYARTPSSQNCRFVCSKYHDLEQLEEPFDVLLSSLGIDFPSAERPDRKNLYAEDPSDALEVEQNQAFLLPILKGWRRIARPGTIASLVFRIPTFEAFWATARAAAAAGWTLWPQSLCRVDGGGEGHLSAFVLNAATGTGEQADLDVLLRAWNERGPHDTSAPALLKYRALRGRSEIAREETPYEDGHVLVREVGAHDNGGYIYDYATSLYRKLQLVPLPNADPKRIGMKVEFGIND